jgi:hypothetical protein
MTGPGFSTDLSTEKRDLKTTIKKQLEWILDPGKEKLSTIYINVDNFYLASGACNHLWAKLAWAFFFVQGISPENPNFFLTFLFY